MNDYLLEIKEVFNKIDTLIEELPKLNIDSKSKKYIKENLESSSVDIFRVFSLLLRLEKKIIG